MQARASSTALQPFNPHPEEPAGRGRLEGCRPQTGLMVRDARSLSSGRASRGPGGAPHHEGLVTLYDYAGLSRTCFFFPMESLITPSGVRLDDVSTIFSSVTAASLTR